MMAKSTQLCACCPHYCQSRAVCSSSSVRVAPWRHSTMGCGGASRLAAANEAIRTADNSPEAQELIASVNVTAKGSDGRIPFDQACKFGRTKMVRFMLENDKKRRIRDNRELLNGALRSNCSGETRADLVELLLKAGAEPNYQVIARSCCAVTSVVLIATCSWPSLRMVTRLSHCLRPRRS